MDTQAHPPECGRPAVHCDGRDDTRSQDLNLQVQALAERLRDMSAGPALDPLTRCAIADDAATTLQTLLQHLADAHATLQQARQELVGTRAGERQARHQAEHDGLTLLPNRHLFQTRLADALCVASPGDTPLAVLYLDLDDFKPINDRHGHDIGDEILRIVAQRLSRAIRTGDMVCRLGGDEFACLLADTMGREQLQQLAAKLFDAVSAPLRLGALELSVRPSIGIAMCPHDGRSAGLLLKRADRAMYRAKRDQLGYAFYDDAAGD